MRTQTHRNTVKKYLIPAQMFHDIDAGPRPPVRFRLGLSFAGL